VSRNPTFKLYEGKSQFLAVFNQILDELKKGDEILAIGEGEDFNEVIYTSYFQEWMKRRIKKGLKTRILGRQNNSFLKAIKTFDKEQLRELKFLPPEFELTEGNLFILPTKIIIWNTVEIQCVVIENRAIASFFKGIFEGVWRQN
jgi:hypothetical protein